MKITWLLVALLGWTALYGDGMIAFNENYTGGLALAQSSRKPVLLYIGTTSPYWRPLDFTDDEVIKFSNKFVCIQVNALEEGNGWILAKYGIKSDKQRVVFFLDPDGNILEHVDTFGNDHLDLLYRMNKHYRAVEASKAKNVEQNKVDDKIKQAEDLYNKSEEAAKAEKYKDQVAHLKKLKADFGKATYGRLADIKLQEIERNPAYKDFLEKTETTELKKWLSTARTYFQNKSYDKAKEYCKKIIDSGQESPEVLEANKLMREMLEVKE